MSENNSWESYDDLIEEGEADGRIGDHIAVIDQLVKDAWKSGDKRYKAIVKLVTANDARADFTLTERKSKDATRKELRDAPLNMRKAITSNLRMHEELHRYFDKTMEDLKEGDKLGVKTVKTKRDPITGKGGFIRVIAFKPLSEIGNGNGEADSNSEVPF